jgi:hypothetical protein
MTLTEIGKELRKMRIDNDEKLMEMAEKLDVSPAFLSAVEIGHKPAPDDFAERIIKAYRLEGSAAETIEKVADRSRRTFKLKPASPMARDTAGLLARKFNSLSADQLSSIRQILLSGKAKKA